LPEYILVVFAWTIILIDFDHHRIPNFITGYLSILFTLIAFARANFLDSVTGGAEFLTFFGFLALLSKGNLGIGDVKLAGVIGLVIGSVSIMEIIKFSIFASIFGLVSICTSRAGISRKARIPFAAPMISACLWIWPMLHMKG
jgi:leader peptidase (prepilin peptidase)/N-methyltransferase